ncbi:T9SS sorting signal type C domain-containing protein [Flavobacterium sp. N502536]|uniref:T9SS sorting signal type C domain-containing protein n=1 Tax=Flavobacterium sp. N502536 TaxID=2986837 RepID=UPI002223172A|nr:T9SS sorting signal type C domain-containing protein [Flavobacterium sp. N502536]
MNKKLLLSFVLFFTYLINYGQCSVYPGSGTTQLGAEQFFCIDGTNPITIGSMTARSYVVVNVIKGYNYRFSVPNTWNSGANIEYLGLFDDATGNAYLDQDSSTGGADITWTATLSGRIRVLLLRGSGCSNTTGSGATLTMRLNTVANTSTSTTDSQTGYGVGSWKGYIYNWTGSDIPPGGFPSSTTLSETTYPFITGSAANYAGYYDVGSDVIPVNFNFGANNDTNCFDVYSEGNVRGSIVTHNFAVRYRMTWNKAPGCYFVKVTGDDGVRLYIDGNRVFDRWVQQTPTNYDYILVNLAANSKLVLDYYENTGNNQLSFQAVPFDANANTITAPATTNFCSGGDPGVIEGSFKYNDSGAESPNPYIDYQWMVSTNGATYVNVPSNGNSRTYDPPVINAAGTNTITKYKRIATINAASAPGVNCVFNESNEVTFVTSPSQPAQPGLITGAATQCTFVNSQVYSVNSVANAVSYDWSLPSGWSIVSGAGTNSITVNIGSTGLSGSIGVRAWNGCGFGTTRTFTVTVNAGSVGGTVTGSSSSCSATNSTVLTLNGRTGSVIRWESSTDDFASVVNAISNTAATYTATNVASTTSYRAVVQNGSCPIAYSASAYVTINRVLTTDAAVCKGGSGSMMANPSTNLGLVIAGSWINTNPLAARPSGTTSCSFPGGNNRYYVASSFQVTVSGTYTFEMNPDNTYDGMGYIVSGAFVPGSCSTGSFIGGDDDSGSDREPLMTVALNAGTIYTLISTTYDGPIATGGFSWKITPPSGGKISTGINWYKDATGGNPIATGASFNPVGVAGSGLMNTDTVATTPYYAAFASNTSCRVQANFVVNPLPATPTVGTVTQLTCTTSGSIALSGLPSGGTLTRSPGAVVVPYTGTVVTDVNLGEGTYTYTVGNGTCTSLATAGIVINPLPVATYNNGWDTPTTAGKKLIFASNFISTGDVNGCSCEVNSGANVTIGIGHTLTITNDVKVLSGGTMTFKNTASLVQKNNVTNTGDITYERTTPPILLKDYVYWSTPVSPQRLVDLSSSTPSTMYYGFDGTQWVRTNRNDNMVIGKGYIIRAPSGYSNSSKTAYPASFKGVPNNGNIETEMLASGKSYLIGNPYPSALSAERVVSEGIEGFIKTNENVINGTLYFWTHNTPAKPLPSNQYSADDYASFNLTGGTAARSDVDFGTGGGVKPTGEIAAGQSFFLTTKAAGKILFTNAMRLGAADNGQFFRSANTSKGTAVEKNRIWLNMTSGTGAFKQLLVGYIEGASNDYESLYDGLTLDGNQYLDFYSVSNADKFVIQARALPFTDSDVVPLGYRTAVAGDFTIGIDEVDGKMAKQVIYIEDKTTGVIHDLTQSNYTFKTEVGNFSERFVLRYTGKTLGIGDLEKVKDGILVSIKNKVIAVQSAQENIKEVTVYDVSGRILYNKKKVSNTELHIQNLPSSNQVLLVKVTLANDFTATRKVIFQ